jgi:hypothetical protein
MIQTQGLNNERIEWRPKDAAAAGSAPAARESGAFVRTDQPVPNEQGVTAHKYPIGKGTPASIGLPWLLIIRRIS